MQPSIGSRYQWRKASPKRWRARKSPIDSASSAIFAGHGQFAGQRVEAQDLPQHAQEARAQQVAALREHGVQVVAAPLDALLRHLHRKGHFRRRRGHLQRVEQLDQPWVGAVVEDQKTGIDTMGNAFEANVCGVAVAAEMRLCFEQRQPRRTRQGVGDRQAADARADDGHAALALGQRRRRMSWIRVRYESWQHGYMS
jgi:hypothetical protein